MSESAGSKNLPGNHSGRLFLYIQRIILTFWIGGVWATGYLVVPAIFGNLPEPAQAGKLAGQLFTLFSWVGLVCAALLSIAYYFLDRAKWRFIVLAIMALLIMINLFYLTPHILEMREQAAAMLNSDMARQKQFAMLHGIASGLYLLTSLLGLLLVLRQPDIETA